MADSKKLIPFIKGSEGGLSMDKSDSASKNPIPDGSGYHTNKGITWTVFSKIFGTGADSIKRFYAMSDDDWNTIYKPLYWDKALGDKINSQRIANLIIDWIWGSGVHYPEIDIQDILIHSFGQHITEDGIFGQATINSVNSVDESAEYQAIIAKRFWYLDQCVLKNPVDQKFIGGWKNRMNNLIKFNLGI